MNSDADDVGARTPTLIEAVAETETDRVGSEEPRSSDYTGRMDRPQPANTRSRRQRGLTGSDRSISTMDTNETDTDSCFGRTAPQLITTTRRTAGERR